MVRGPRGDRAAQPHTHRSVLRQVELDRSRTGVDEETQAQLTGDSQGTLGDARERGERADDPETAATLEQNLTAIEKTEAFLDRVREQRPSLIAQLDKILFGLRSTRAQLVAEVSRETAADVEAAAQLAATIEGDIKEMTRGIQAVDGMRAEIDDLVRDRAKKAASRQTQ